ncbi:hypothetical protein RV11_GL003267 [Enterococcus phoeniculicola]|jgi:hypothetical protein|uniref:Uncharacterized protein n=1 Tax=Enterococcus phoeniculicola ATCC BAA-412 TaxID=1158610 RepID=R3WMS7_9ENTE|nr:hypothetical protein [Enterococcus phoeniculicola]EOL48772.1 hypothetical protein UC3_00323 [Enterococcus phoeniculicola ATCC BAA-412]EOT72618.1 hypothetical protein I589_02887 [Enterococcus phoeniculicola ATCC BAA-412]OJG71892.1 hypothetical protein RV11_GL003267 [Enterococcus phoeniculicola]
MLSVALAGLIGVLVGAGIVSLAFYLQLRYQEKKELRRRSLENKVREIEVLNELNKKVNEILQKRNVLLEKYVSFDAFDDCYITIDDFVYLQTFTSQNNFYLPNYILEQFFKNIAHRKVVLSPDETVKIGGYTYKGGRVILENFSEELIEMINEKKIQMKQLTNDPVEFFSGK